MAALQAFDLRPNLAIYLLAAAVLISSKFFRYATPDFLFISASPFNFEIVLLPIDQIVLPLLGHSTLSSIVTSSFAQI